MGHAKLSPSAAHRWMSCPGSIELSAGYPDTSSRFADEGTFAHAVAADALFHDRKAEEYVGVRSSDICEIEGFTFDADMADHVQTYLDVVTAIPNRAFLEIEQEVHLLGITDEVWGTADAVVLERERPGEDVLHVIDLKFGAGVRVEVNDNPQLKIYGLGALCMLPRVENVYRVDMHIVQPRHSQGGHSVYSMPAADLMTWGKIVLTSRIRATESRDPELSAGEWCRFCPAKNSCTEIRDFSLDRARVVFADETLTPKPVPADSLTPYQLGQALTVFPIVEDWMKSVRVRAYELANHGTEIPGHKMVRGTGHRKWRSEDEARAALELFDVDPNAAPKMITPAEAERRLGKKHKALVEQLAFKPEGGTSLAPLADPRPAVRGAAEVFGTFPEKKESITNDES